MAKYGSAEYERQVAEMREGLEHTYGTVWTTDEVMRDFEITGFLAPRCAAIHRETGIKGTLAFTHSPRFYFDFRPASEADFSRFEDATKITIVSM